MRKIILVLTLLLSVIMPLSGCTPQKTAYRVYVPDGAPAIALSKFMYEGYDGAEFTVVPTTANIAIAQRVARGDADFAILPIDAAAKLYVSGVDIVMLSVNTHGNLYVIGDGESATLDDFVGKRLGVIGRGNVPDNAIKMLLGHVNIEYTESDKSVPGKVALQYVGAGSALSSLFESGQIDYGFLAEPAVTALTKKLGKNIVTDIQSEWENAFGGEFPQACLVAKRAVIESDKAFADGLLAALKDSDGWAEEHPQEAVQAVNSNLESGEGSSLGNLAEGTVKRCNIRTVFATDAKPVCELYFSKLTKLQTALGSVIDGVPDDGFYYGG